MPEPPEEWRIVVVGDTISVFGDGNLLAEVQDGTHRGGLFGFWAWNGQSLAIDDLEITTPGEFLLPCFTVAPDEIHEPLDDLTFDASCTESSDPIASYTWDFGDGSAAASGQVVEHSFESTGSYDVSLTVENEAGATEKNTVTVLVTVTTDHFEDDFDQDDGEPENWTITTGAWNVFDGALGVEVFGPPEAWIFAGSPPVVFSDISGFSLRVTFANDPMDVVGRHGGILFFAENSSPRFSGNSGYTIDWIDRTDDRGYRVIRWDAGVATALGASLGDPAAEGPGEEWEVEIDDESFRLIVDGEEQGEIIDATYRQGQFALWSYTNNQSIVFDDVLIGEPDVEEDGFRRGDTDASGVVDISDPIFNLTFQFVGGIDDLPCEDAADVDDSGVIDISDPIYNLTFQFVGGITPPSAPGPTDCGPDPTGDERSCLAYPQEKC